MVSGDGEGVFFPDITWAKDIIWWLEIQRAAKGAVRATSQTLGVHTMTPEDRIS